MIKRESVALLIKYYPLLLTIVLSVVPLTTSAIIPRKTTNLKNSPIYYIAAPLINRSTMPQMPIVGQHYKPYGYNQFYKLPIQFLSNAKPVDIIKGISTKTNTKKVIYSGYKGYKKPQMSKLVYLPLNYLSNAKPIKILLNPFGKK